MTLITFRLEKHFPGLPIPTHLARLFFIRRRDRGGISLITSMEDLPDLHYLSRKKTQSRFGITTEISLPYEKSMRHSGKVTISRFVSIIPI